MRTYRLYFLDVQIVPRFDLQADADYRTYFLDDHIIGLVDFQAEDDDRAAEIAEIMFDACSDRCRSWQIWEGAVFLASGPRTVGARSRASGLTEQRQKNIVECEEAVLNSEWAIASSKRLLAKLDKLKASKKEASRYLG